MHTVSGVEPKCLRPLLGGFRAFSCLDGWPDKLEDASPAVTLNFGRLSLGGDISVPK